MLTDFYKPIIPYYSPVSAKGGSKSYRRRRISTRKFGKLRSKKCKRSNGRTRRRYH